MKGGNSRLIVLYILVLFLLVFIPSSLAVDYYADIILEVNEVGSVDVSGKTNLNIIGEDIQNFTSKKGKYWILNYSIEEEISDYIVEISLPKNVEINYIKLPSLNRIVAGDKTRIITSGENSNLEIVIQYSFVNKEGENNSIAVIILVLIFILVGLGVFYYIMKKRSKKPRIDMSRLSNRQKDIVGIVIKNPEGITQAKLEQITKLPKASLSRNIASLERFDIIEKKEYGMSNLIRLKRSDNNKK